MPRRHLFFLKKNDGFVALFFVREWNHMSGTAILKMRRPTVDIKAMDQYWGERAKSYSEQNQAQLEDGRCQAWERVIFERLPSGRKLKILDVGCGPGFLAILMARAGHYATGADLNSAMLDQARKNADKHGVCVEFVQIDGTLPFEDDSFDVILARDVTWTLPKPEMTMAHWFSKVAPGGKLLYFDAGWYSYLNSPLERAKYKSHRKLVEKNHGFVYSKAKQMEAMAVDLPMTYRMRPAWDMEFWSSFLESQVTCVENLNSRIYNPMEQLQYALTPEFLVEVKKTAAGQKRPDSDGGER